MSGVIAQLGVVDEVTWGTAVTVTRFFEFNEESMELDAQRIESAGLRAGTRSLRSDRFAINRKGAAGSVTMEVLSKGFGWWLKHLQGTVATGALVDSTYTHTGTVGSLVGDSFTMQVGKPDTADTVRPFTYTGCKVPGWKLSCDVDGIALLEVDVDAKDEDTAVALATASYPTAAELLTFVGGQLNVGGVATDIVDVTISVGNSLKTDRHYQRRSSLKKEQLENGWREITADITVDFDSMAHYNRFASLTATGALAAVDVGWRGPTLAGATTYPELKATLANARFDGSTPKVEGPDLIQQKITLKGLADSTNGAIKLDYVTTDATP